MYDFEDDMPDEKHISKKAHRRDSLKTLKKGTYPAMHGCTRKQAYQTRKKALGIANQCTLAEGIALRVYKCPWCHYFHLTHQEQQKKRHHRKQQT